MARSLMMVSDFELVSDTKGLVSESPVYDADKHLNKRGRFEVGASGATGASLVA